MKEHLLQTLSTELIALAKYDEQGYPFWENSFFDKDTRAFLKKDFITLFNGDAGICYFFLCLYRTRERKEDLLLATRAFAHIAHCCQTTPPAFYCFYTGISGIIYLAIIFYETTGEQHFLDTAVLLAFQHMPGILKVPEMDLLSGAAGNLLVLTHLYHYHKSATLLGNIHQLLQRIIDDARVSSQGIKWDHHKMAYDSLTGFSHGAAGIAYALLETGRYFGYTGLYALAKAGLDYELQYYDASQFTWPDLRIGRQRYNLPRAHTWRLDIFKEGMKPVNSWAHGPAGIAITYLRYAAITGDMAFEEILHNCIQRCLQDIRTAREDYTLCSGYAGIAIVLEEYARHYPHLSGEIQAAMDQITTGAAALYNTTGSFNTFTPANREDPGLFSGRAGVAYMLLSDHSNNILLPVLPVNKNVKEDQYTVNAICMQVLGKYFPRTIAAIPHLPHYENVFSMAHFTAFLAKHLHTDTGAAIFPLECAALELWQQHKGYLCYYKKSTYRSQHAIVPENITAATTLRISDEVRLYYHMQHHVLLEMTPEGIHERVMEKLPAAILALLQQEKSSHELLEGIHSLIQPQEGFMATCLQLLSKMINAGWIVICPEQQQTSSIIL